MTENDAKEIAQRCRTAHAIPSNAFVGGITGRYIEVTVGQLNDQFVVRDVRVWVVRFQHGIMWVDLAIDEQTGEVIRVERSRSRG